MTTEELRGLLLWQIRWLIYHYALDRMWHKMANPLWALYERALETGDWDEYRVAYAARDRLVEL